MIATGNSSPGECSSVHGRDLVIKMGLWAASHSFAMLQNHGCRLDQHHDVKGLRPNPVKPHPEKTVGAERPRTARVLAPQDGHLVPKGDEFPRSAATKAKRGEGNDGSKNRYHADDGRGGDAAISRLSQHSRVLSRQQAPSKPENAFAALT